jgi:hypothetical protein
VSQAQAQQVLAAPGERMSEVGLRLHPEKTGIVSCKDGKRGARYEHTAFTFLGYTFQARRVRMRTGRMATGFTPAIGRQALNNIGTQVRAWSLHRRTETSEVDLARRINPIVRGWMNYYGAFYRSALYPLLTRINAYLMRWLRKKHKRLRAQEGTERVGKGGQAPAPLLRPLGLVELGPVVW